MLIWRAPDARRFSGRDARPPNNQPSIPGPPLFPQPVESGILTAEGVTGLFPWMTA